MIYEIEYAIHGYQKFLVESNSLEEAKIKANTAFEETDFGTLEEVTGEMLAIYDENDHELWCRH